MSSEHYIVYAVEGPVAVVTYDRPHRRNAWDAGMYRAIHAAIERANADAAIGAILIAATGPVFCAGVDLKAPPEPRDPATGKRPNMATLSMAEGDNWLTLIARSKPVVAAIQGPAIGAGVTQILPFDLRIGGASSTYSFPFVKLGTMPELGATALLPQLIGYGRALDLCLNAATIDAHEAARIGLIARVVADADLHAEALATATRIAGFDRDAVRITKAMFEGNRGETDADRLLARERDGFIERIRLRRAEQANLGATNG
ncbi:enoyl-CoA hydratase/isomerase family protein [Sphingomonas immobilis]|uniref:Enoyl-CoA hydratase-related protein n=1 Tax=Sphingomonas immobilis TaxID=3063997 RepID=A0ABT8ZYB3_9SPHN|nr:enoyl-CoA hydratase-related protein [Sphingomonas sp. CA1-15]MDO7842192.1 enoyl-CoA hydratase-related protein [Sphingomonas sp. CA1-15]